MKEELYLCTIVYLKKKIHQEIPRKSDYWNGDVWKAYVRVRNERKDVEMCVVDTDTGVGIIKILNKENYLFRTCCQRQIDFRLE